MKLLKMICAMLILGTGITAAHASPPEPINVSPVAAVSQLHQVVAKSSRVNRVGRLDTVLHSRSQWPDVLAFYKKMYAESTSLPGGFECIGYFVMPGKGIANITLKRGKKAYTISLEDGLDGTNIVVWGNHRTRHRKKTRIRRRAI